VIINYKKRAGLLTDERGYDNRFFPVFSFALQKKAGGGFEALSDGGQKFGSGGSIDNAMVSTQ